MSSDQNYVENDLIIIIIIIINWLAGLEGRGVARGGGGGSGTVGRGLTASVCRGSRGDVVLGVDQAGRRGALGRAFEATGPLPGARIV